MTQSFRRLYLLKALRKERTEYASLAVPEGEEEQKRLLRALLNIRPPLPADPEFLLIQDAYLQAETARKGITDAAELIPLQKGIYLWQGDITTLRCDAIVNAANSELLGCFCPNHGCIDNAIHTFAGVQLRLECARLMERQGHREETGTAKLTLAYNLPCRYVLHTVGPVVSGPLTEREENQLASCYRACLKLAEENGLKSVAFCCISTGEFRFPRERAAKLAIQTVREYLARTDSPMEVIFNVFQEADYRLYRDRLEAAGAAEA